MRVIRLCTRNYPDIKGVGAFITGGRWNSPGIYMAYTASCGALAILEYMAHLSTLPRDMLLLVIEIPDTLEIDETNSTPGDPLVFRQIGDEWIKARKTAVLRVPSVLAPGQKNYLINPKHKLFKAIKIIKTEPFAFDSRLLSSIPPPP